MAHTPVLGALFRGREPSLFAAVTTPLASIADTVRAVSDAAGQFFDDISRLHWGSLGIALGLFFIYLLLRSRASLSALRAAYPQATISWRRIWGAYVAAYGLNGVVPAGSGSIVQVVLTQASIPNSSYPTVTTALSSVGIFDSLMCVIIMGYAFTQGVFPKPSDFAGLSSFDLAFFARHPAFTLFLITALAVAAVATFAILSRRIAAFWSHVRQGLAILSDRRAYLVGMVLPQLGGWMFRIASYWFLLDAFRVGGSIRGAVLVLAAQILAAIVPFTPGGVGVQQALIVVIFSGAASASTVAAYSVGQQIAVTSFTLALGLGALAVVFRIRSFRHVIRDARATRAAEEAAA